MKSGRGCSTFTILIVLGLAAALALVGFVGATSLVARAEREFGPPAGYLNPLQRARLGITLGWRAETLLRSVDAAAGTQPFAIDLDEATGSILMRLQGQGLIREAGLMRDYLVYTGLDTQLQAGEFELSAAMNTVEIVDALLDPEPGLVTLSILPGWRLEEIAASIPSSGLEFELEEFLAAALTPPDGYAILEWLPNGGTLEGYLLPGNYELEREASVEEVIELLLEHADEEIGEALRAGFAAQGLNPHQALTVASIVERESVLEEEMGRIASVFLNRFGAGQKLEADPTVQYALGYDETGQSWWTNPLLNGHLRVESQYNTYVHAGLPPGPIASPSLAALQAVAHPEETDYFYFQAACDGSGAHVFAVTFEEHVGNNCE